MSSVNLIRAGIAEMHTSGDRTAVLSAPHLGSCLGIAVYHPPSHCGGIIHCLLPFSKKDPEKAKAKPTMYVDTGITSLLAVFTKKGLPLNQLEIYVAGGASINDANNVFEIGKKNYTVLKKLLWKNKLLIKGEDVGGENPRTIALHLENGLVTVQSNGSTIEL